MVEGSSAPAAARPEFQLPPELEGFLTLPGPRSLLIRGPPGTGKTTLALSLLEAFTGTRMLVTGRVAPAEIAREFPWLTGSGNAPIQIIDTTTPAPGIAPSADRRDPSTHKPHAEPASEPPSTGPWIPPTLREAWGRAGSDPHERRDLQWLPPALREAWGRLVPDQPALIVIDSWDAFVEDYLGTETTSRRDLPDRPELERMLLRQIRRGTAHVVLVLERRDEAQLDYLVDAIVATHWEDFEGHMERWVRIPKLRGQMIRSQAYPFSLENGQFHCVTPSTGAEGLICLDLDPDPNPSPRTVWPGCAAFPKAFGRPALGSVMLLERDEGVPINALASILFPMMLSVLEQGGRVLAFPGPNIDLAPLIMTYRASFTPDRLINQVRFVAPSGGLAPENWMHRVIIPIPEREEPVNSGLGPRIPLARDFISAGGKPGAPNMVVVIMDALREIAELTGEGYTVENLPVIIKSYQHGAPNIAIFTAQRGDPFLHGVRSLAAKHLQLRDREGRPVIYGIRPPTHGHIMSYGPDAHGHPYELLKFV